MQLSRFQPCPALAPYVREYLLLESAPGMQNLVLPDTALVLAICYHGSVVAAADGLQQKLPAAMLTGLRNSARQLTYAPQTATLLIIFRELGAAAFFRPPLHELFGTSEALEQLWPAAEVRAVAGQLAEAASHPQRVALLERHLLQRLHAPRPDAVVRQAIRRIQAAQGSLSIRAVLAELPLSRDPFEKRFRRLVGTSPKQFAAIVRLRALLAQQQRQPLRSLTEAAHAAGYFDQAHFNKDFKAFTSQTPHAFLTTARYW